MLDNSLIIHWVSRAKFAGIPTLGIIVLARLITWTGGNVHTAMLLSSGYNMLVMNTLVHIEKELHKHKFVD